MRVSVLVASIGFLTLARPDYASGFDPSILSAFGDLAPGTASVETIIICHGFGCKFRTPIALGDADRSRLRALMAPGRASPEAERRAIANAVAWLEHRVAPEAGTAKAKPRANGLTVAGDPGQLDCIDASWNTTSFLAVLEGLNVLHFHRLQRPVARGFLIDGRGPHMTAVILDGKTGQNWAVDAWTRRTGEKPEIMLLERWFAASE